MAGAKGDDAKAEKSDEVVFATTSRFREALALVARVDAKKLPVLLGRVLGALSQKGGVTASGGKKRVFSEEEEVQIREMFSLSQPELDMLVESSSYVFEQAAYRGLTPERLAAALVTAGLGESFARSFGGVWANGKEAFIKLLTAHTLGAPLYLRSTQWSLQMSAGQSELSRTRDLNAVFTFELGDKNAEASRRMALEQSFGGAENGTDGADGNDDDEDEDDAEDSDDDEDVDEEKRQRKKKEREGARAAAKAAKAAARKRAGLDANNDSALSQFLAVEFSRDSLSTFYDQMEKIQKQLDALTAT